MEELVQIMADLFVLSEHSKCVLYSPEPTFYYLYINSINELIGKLGIFTVQEIYSPYIEQHLEILRSEFLKIFDSLPYKENIIIAIFECANKLNMYSEQKTELDLIPQLYQINSICSKIAYELTKIKTLSILSPHKIVATNELWDFMSFDKEQLDNIESLSNNILEIFKYILIIVKKWEQLDIQYIIKLYIQCLICCNRIHF